MTQIPSIGGIVHYCLTADDAVWINRLRMPGLALKKWIAGRGEWPKDAPAHVGNTVTEGDIFPAMIVKAWGSDETSAVQLQVFLDGNDTFWATSIVLGEGPRKYRWPPRV